MPDEYHKISGPFKRDANDIKKIDRSLWVDDTVELLASHPIWNATEKIDGTNIRVVWNGHDFAIHGRTDRAELHGDLIKRILGYFGEGVEEKVEEMFGEKEVIFFGEGYGAGIQSGGAYSANKEFIGFDVRVNGSYVDFENCNAIYDALAIPSLEPLYSAPSTLDSIISLVSGGLYSDIGDDDHLAEGVVARPVKPLYDRRGNRIIVKVKARDLV